jgi:lysophospholipase L1-like esterase
MTASRPRRTLRTKLLLAVLGPVVALGLLEIALRVADYRYEPWARWADAHDEFGERRIYAKHPELLWTLRPSSEIHAPEQGFEHVRSNAHGLRGPELPADRQGDEVRVLCLGDSITFGLGLADGATWPDHCALHLRAAPELAGRPVTVVSAAVPGWSSVQGMRQLDALRELRPDVVVFWFAMNDAKPAQGFRDSAQRPGGEGRRQLLARLRGSRVFQLVQSMVSESREDPESRVTLEEYRSAVRGLLEAEKAGGPPVIFVRTPHRVPATRRELEHVLGRAEEEGAREVAGPAKLLTPWSPAPAGCDSVGTLVSTPDGPTLVFAATGRASTVSIDEIRSDLEMLDGYERRLRSLLELLPEGSLDGEDLFAGTPLHANLSDNCHLTRAGAERTGLAIAREVLRRLGESR